MPPDALDTLAESLAGTFPGCEDTPLALALLRELARRRASRRVDTRRASGHRARALAKRQLRQGGRVVAFSGLSLTSTAHRFTIGGRQLYTWCAWDTLFLPAMLGRPADVESTCAVTGSDVRLTVDPNGVRQLDPQPLWVSFPPAATTSTADITGAFCCHVHFLAMPAAAEHWLNRHPDDTVLDIDDAYKLGRKATRCCTG